MALDQTKHKSVLIKILKSIFAEESICSVLGFKGGTAASLFYDLDRFSVDLDFDLLDMQKEDEVFNKVGKILKTYGKLKDMRKKNFNLFYLLSYNKKDIGGQNIKVEINRRNFGSKFEVLPYLGIPMKVMVRPDMAAHKLCAMFERITKTNRDIYDVYFFLNNDWPINKQIVENRLGLPFDEFIKKCIVLLEKMNDARILSGMGELLTEKQKQWMKAKLKTETIFLLKLMLQNEKEKTFGN